MTPELSKKVIDRVKEDFSSHHFQEVIQVLAMYGKEEYEREHQRVQLGILKLSKGNMEDLYHYLEQAKKDYRDILYWAEYD